MGPTIDFTSIDRSINQSIKQSINQSISQSLFVQLSTKQWQQLCKVHREQDSKAQRMALTAAIDI